MLPNPAKLISYRQLERSAKALAEIPIRYHVQTVMTDAHEKRLIEALRKVDAHGDVAPAHVQDPMTMVLRQRAIQADLMRWDDSRGHYVLTGTGRSRISARSRVPGAMRFVELKTQEQLDMRTLQRSRDQLVAERTALINQFDDRIGSKALSR